VRVEGQDGVGVTGDDAPSTSARNPDSVRDAADRSATIGGQDADGLGRFAIKVSGLPDLILTRLRRAGPQRPAGRSRSVVTSTAA